MRRRLAGACKVVFDESLLGSFAATAPEALNRILHDAGGEETVLARAFCGCAGEPGFEDCVCV